MLACQYPVLTSREVLARPSSVTTVGTMKFTLVVLDVCGHGTDSTGDGAPLVADR